MRLPLFFVLEPIGIMPPNAAHASLALDLLRKEAALDLAADMDKGNP